MINDIFWVCVEFCGCNNNFWVWWKQYKHVQEYWDIQFSCKICIFHAWHVVWELLICFLIEYGGIVFMSSYVWTKAKRKSSCWGRAWILRAKTTTIITWNVQTLYQCSKLTQLQREFDNYHLDIVDASKMRWVDSAKMYHDWKTTLYSGNDECMYAALV